MDIPKRRLGRTGADVTILGLGGEGVLRTFGREKDAYRLINEAIDLGITSASSGKTPGSLRDFLRSPGMRKRR